METCSHRGGCASLTPNHCERDWLEDAIASYHDQLPAPATPFPMKWDSGIQRNAAADGTGKALFWELPARSCLRHTEAGVVERGHLPARIGRVSVPHGPPFTSSKQVDPCHCCPES